MTTTPSGVPDLALQEPTLANGGISNDGLHITFHLRRGVVWQDGAPFTSRDVRFTYAAELNPKNNVGSRAPFEDIASVSTPDAYTAIFNLKAPRASILSDLWEAIIPEHLLGKEASLNHVPFNGAPVGTGPFRVTEWKRGDHVSLVANERYWRGAPKVRTIHIAFVPDVQTIVVQLKTGEANFWWNADSTLLPQVRSPQLRVARTWTRVWTSLRFNLSDPEIEDVRVRRAIAQAVDADRIARDVVRDPQRRKNVLAAAFGWAYDPRVRLSVYDPAQAAKSLDAAGWRLGPDRLRHKNGRTLSLLLVYGNYSATLRNMALLIASDLQRVGISVTHKTAPFAQLYATPENGGIILAGKFQINLGATVTNPDPDVSWLYSCSELPPHGFNYSRYCNAQVDGALRDGRTTYDMARRRRDYAIVQRRLAEDVPEIFLMRGREYDVAPVWLTHLKPSPFSPFWNAGSW